jgi:hypothetical protein|tara:strand:+ start:923 stop:1291 length:369 start_codon:yes stop_codon:yes gene_type:complete
MAILFSEIITVQTFDCHGYYPIKMRKCKDFDGPNIFSLLWNQLLILWQNKLISDSNSLKKKYNPIILHKYAPDICQEIDTILYKFLDLDMRSVTLYYDTYQLKNNVETIRKLYNLKKLLNNL